MLAWGASVALVGEGLRVWAAGHLNKAREVTMSGPYRWFAHPLYVGSSLMGTGLAIASNSVVVGVFIGIYFLVMIPAAIRSEEEQLRRTFGERYVRYRRGDRVEHGAIGDAAVRRFSFARAVANREHRAVAGLLVVLLLLVFKATYNGLFWRAVRP